MSRFSDLYGEESIRRDKPIPLSNAKSYWLSKFGSQHQDFQIALAPHTVRLMECCSIAVNKYCVVIGTAQETVPRTSTAHRILDLQNHPTYDKTIDIIRDFLTVLKLKKTYTFRVEEPLGPNGKIAMETVLIAIWKFITLFEAELNDEESMKEVFATFFEKQKLKISKSEVKAVMNGSERNAYINVINEDMRERRYRGKETELKSENCTNLFREFDLIYVRSSLSESDPSSYRFFSKDQIDRIREGFQALIYEEDDNMDIENEMNQIVLEYNTIGKILFNYSKSRIEQTPFHGSSYEKDYHHILTELTNKHLDQQQIIGGCATNEGIILLAFKSLDVIKSPAFIMSLTEAFLDRGKHPTYINVEKLKAGCEARPVQPADYQNEQNNELTKINIVPSSKLADAGLLASSSTSFMCQEQDQHFVLDNSDIVETDDDCAEIY